jgi:hypothetical protein
MEEDIQPIQEMLVSRGLLLAGDRGLHLPDFVFWTLRTTQGEDFANVHFAKIILLKVFKDMAKQCYSREKTNLNDSAFQVAARCLMVLKSLEGASDVSPTTILARQFYKLNVTSGFYSMHHWKNKNTMRKKLHAFLFAKATVIDAFETAEASLLYFAAVNVDND